MCLPDDFKAFSHATIDPVNVEDSMDSRFKAVLQETKLNAKFDENQNQYTVYAKCPVSL